MMAARASLPAHLKSTAMVLALHGDDDGDSIYPSLQTLVGLTSKSPESVRRDLRQLRELGVLGPGTRARGRVLGGYQIGGRGRRNVHRLDLVRLQELADEPSQATAGVKAGAHDRKADRPRPEEACVPDPKGDHRRPETTNVPMTTVQETTVQTSGAASPQASSAPDHAYHALAAVARSELKGNNPPADQSELVDRLKWHSAQRGIDRFADTPSREASSPDLVVRVAESEWFKHHELARLHQRIFASAESQPRQRRRRVR